MINTKTVSDRYQNDSSFKTLVDLLLYNIREARYTPTEIREAAMFAQIIYEETTIRPIFLNVVRNQIK